MRRTCGGVDPEQAGMDSRKAAILGGRASGAIARASSRPGRGRRSRRRIARARAGAPRQLATGDSPRRWLFTIMHPRLRRPDAQGAAARQVVMLARRPKTSTPSKQTESMASRQIVERMQADQPRPARSPAGDRIGLASPRRQLSSIPAGDADVADREAREFARPARRRRARRVDQVVER